MLGGDSTADLNCGFCEKCVRSRMQLYVCGARDGLDSFPKEVPLRPALSSLRALDQDTVGQWDEIAARLNDDDADMRQQSRRFASRNPEYPAASSIKLASSIL